MLLCRESLCLQLSTNILMCIISCHFQINRCNWLSDSASHSWSAKTSCLQCDGFPAVTFLTDSNLFRCCVSININTSYFILILEFALHIIRLTLLQRKHLSSYMTCISHYVLLFWGCLMDTSLSISLLQTVKTNIRHDNSCALLHCFKHMHLYVSFIQKGFQNELDVFFLICLRCSLAFSLLCSEISATLIHSRSV